MAQSTHRRAMIAKIKIAQKQLGMDDDVYRELLHRMAGKRSCTELTATELARVLREMERLGFAPSRPAPERMPLRQAAHADDAKNRRAFGTNRQNMGLCRRYGAQYVRRGACEPAGQQPDAPPDGGAANLRQPAAKPKKIARAEWSAGGKNQSENNIIHQFPKADYDDD